MQPRVLDQVRIRKAFLVQNEKVRVVVPPRPPLHTSPGELFFVFALITFLKSTFLKQFFLFERKVNSRGWYKEKSKPASLCGWPALP